MQVRLTIREYADTVGVSYTTARKWIAQGRIPVQRLGAMYVVLTNQPPEKLHGGELNAEARARWCYGRRYRPGAKENAAPRADGA